MSTQKGCLFVGVSWERPLWCAMWNPALTESLKCGWWTSAKNDWPPGKMSCDHVMNWCIVGNWQTSWHKEVNFFSWYLINLLLCWKEGKWSVTSEGERTEMWRWGTIEGDHLFLYCCDFLLGYTSRKHTHKMIDLAGKMSCDHVTNCDIVGNWQTSWYKEANFFLDTWSIYSCVERKGKWCATSWKVKEQKCEPCQTIEGEVLFPYCCDFFWGQISQKIHKLY